MRLSSHIAFRALALTASAIVLAACDSTPPPTEWPGVSLGISGEPERWDCVSALKSHAPIEELLRIANDRSCSSSERAKAICTIFANHIRPLSNSQQAFRTLTSSEWLDDSSLQGVYSLAGWVPVKWWDDRTVFGLCVCAQDWRGGNWYVWFSLDGQRTEADAMAFLRGEYDNPDVHLIEFAISFPREADVERIFTSRCERFAERGVAVFWH